MPTPRELELISALEMALEWIDAVPPDTAASLPVMPGFDRDAVDSLIQSVKSTKSLTLSEALHGVSVPQEVSDEAGLTSEQVYTIIEIAASDDEQVIKDYKIAHVKANGYPPKISKSGGWYSVSCGSFRKIELLAMTQTLTARFEKQRDEIATA